LARGRGLEKDPADLADPDEFCGSSPGKTCRYWAVRKRRLAALNGQQE